MNTTPEITPDQSWEIVELFAINVAGYSKGNHGAFFDKNGQYAGRGDSLFKFIESFDAIAPYLLEWQDTSLPGPHGGVVITVTNSLSLRCKVWGVELMDVTTNKAHRRMGTVLATTVVLCLLDAHGIDTGIPK